MQKYTNGLAGRHKWEKKDDEIDDSDLQRIIQNINVIFEVHPRTDLFVIPRHVQEMIGVGAGGIQAPDFDLDLPVMCLPRFLYE